VGNFKLRGRGGSDTKAHALEMLDLLEGGGPGTMPPSDITFAPAPRRKTANDLLPTADGLVTALMFGPSINEPAVVY